MTRLSGLLCCSLLLKGTGDILRGQPTSTAGIVGNVFDPTGGSVSKAAVRAQSISTGFRWSATTGDTGEYRLLSLAPGIYEIRVRAAGFADASVSAVKLSVGEDARIDFRLALRARTETLTVTAEAETLREGSTTGTSQVLDRSETETLPTTLRNYVQLALLTPKVLPASSTAARGYMGDRYRDSQFSFEGVRPQYNYETIDGSGATIFMTNTLKTFYSLESVEEFRVTNSLYTAEEGHAMGGVVNVITRSGSNELHGGTYNYFRNNTLDKPDLLAVPYIRELRMNQFGLFTAGPAVRNRLFLYGNYEGQRMAKSPSLSPLFLQNLTSINAALARLGFPEENPRVLQTADSDQFLIRSDYLPSAAHHLTIRDNFYFMQNRNDRIGAHGQLDDPIAPSGARDGHLRDEDAAASLTSFLHPNWNNVARVGLGKHNSQLRPIPGVPAVQVVVRGVFSSGVDSAEVAGAERIVQAQDTLTWTRGHHELRFGAEYLRADASQAIGSWSQAIVPGLEGLLAPVPVIQQTVIAKGALPSGYIFGANQTGAFIQEDWKIAHSLTLNVGLRYDLEMPRGITTIVNSGPGNWQPRMGLTWSPFRAIPVSVRAGVGLYSAGRSHARAATDAIIHGNGFPSFSQGFLQANPEAREFRPLPETLTNNFYTGAAAYPALYQLITMGQVPSGVAPAGLAAVVENPALPNPYAEQWGLDLDYRIGLGFTLSAGYSGLHSLRLPVPINRNLRAAIATLPNGENDYQVAGPNAAARLYDPRFAYIYFIDPEGSSSYHAATLTIRKKFMSCYSLGANYVFSRNLDDFGAVSITTAPQDSYSIRTDRAVSSESAKHRSSFWLVAEGPPKIPYMRGFTLSVITTVQSPRYFNVTAGIDLNHDLNVNTDRPDSLGRNTFRGDNFFTVDLRAGRRFLLREWLGVDLTADLFNLLNRVNVTDLDTVYGRATLALPPVAGFNTARAVGNAFQMQLGLRIAF